MKLFLTSLISFILLTCVISVVFTQTSATNNEIESTSLLSTAVDIETTTSIPVDAELNEKLEINKPTNCSLSNSDPGTTRRKESDSIKESVRKDLNVDVAITKNVFEKLYNIIVTTIDKILKAPKVNRVLRSIGICAVNGAMEIISFYLPAPLIPLVASAAGMVIPFEPVVMLKERLPVTSYRRALNSAVNSFMGTFKKYKLDDEEDDDPYLNRRFNRRFMGPPKSEENGTSKNWF